MLSVQTKVTLNKGQQEAADGFFEFLLSPEKEMILSGPGGVGKTFLMGYLIDRVLPQYLEICAMTGVKEIYEEVVMTATTNKAVEVIATATQRPAQTIHSFLNLTIKDDYKTGNSILTRSRSWQVHSRKIIFIDECSMIDSQLLKMIHEGTHQCKVIYIGDHCQLSPITEVISPIYRMGLPFYELTEPMRNAEQPALMRLCQQLRDTVETKVFKPIHLVPGVIDRLNDSDMTKQLAITFAQQTKDSRVLAYTNQRVVEYNDHFRTLRGLPAEYSVGEFLINNNSFMYGTQLRLGVETEVEVIQQNKHYRTINIEGNTNLIVRPTSFKTSLGSVFVDVPLPVNMAYCTSLLKYYAKLKNWKQYFYIKDTFPDLRPRDAATVHKAQGSTYDTVFIDLDNLNTCHNPNIVARMLYVAVTRAKSNVIFYGDLAPKYGGIAVTQPLNSTHN